MLLHELGHLEKKHLTHTTGLTNRQLQNERGLSALQGFVSTAELEADAFAVEEVSKDRVLNTLDFMIEARKKRNDRIARIAIREMELRKEYIICNEVFP